MPAIWWGVDLGMISTNFFHSKNSSTDCRMNFYIWGLDVLKSVSKSPSERLFLMDRG